jgi:hypothetical protein
MEPIEDRKTGKPKKRAVVFFENIDKGLILNATNRETLNGALGKAPAGWLGAGIGIVVDPNVMYGGVRKGGVRLRVLLPPATAAKPTPKPPPPAAAATEWPEETGDPGFDPDLNDAVPDFGAAR